MVCVDASVILAWLLPEDLSEHADALLARLYQEGEPLLAPALLTAEVSSGLRRAVYRKRLTPGDGDEAWGLLSGARLQLHDLAALAAPAWSLGKTVNAPALYDMFYLALAEREDCDLWTADRRFISLLGGRFPRVRFLGSVDSR